MIRSENRTSWMAGSAQERVGEGIGFYTCASPISSVAAHAGVAAYMQQAPSGRNGCEVKTW